MMTSMGYSTNVTQEPRSNLWLVTVKVVLSRAEGNELFLSGDSMVSWPVEGLEASGSADPRLERSGMFVSEMAARPSGLVIGYSGQSEAERAAKLFRIQFAQIGIEEES
jgi:hypothetical protein